MRGPIIPWLLSGVALVAGITLRWFQLGRASLWFDEGYTAWAVSLPVKQIVRVIRVDTAPPLYYLMLHAWTQLAGRSEAGLRSMSALMASIGLLTFAAIAKKLFTSPWAVATSIVSFSISFMQIAYAHEARFYAMMTMMGAVDLYLLLLICQRSTALRLTMINLAWVSSLYTNNMMAVYLACLGLAWLLIPGERSIKGRWRDLLIVSISSALCFAPWVPSVLSQTHRIQGAFWAETPDKWTFVGALSTLAGVHERGLGHQTLFATAVLILACIFCLRATEVQRRLMISLMCFGGLPVIFIYLYSQNHQSIFIDRAFLPTGLVLSLLIGCAIEAVRYRIDRLLCFAAVIMLAVLSLRAVPEHLGGEHPEAWREASAFAQSSGASHRLVICIASDGEPLYRYYGCQSDYALRPDVTGAPTSFFAPDPPVTMQQVKTGRDIECIRAAVAKPDLDEIVLIASHSWWGDPDERVLRLLTQNFAQTERKVFSAITVFRYRIKRSV